MNSKQISSIINELGEDRQDYFHSVAPPVMQTSNFSFTCVEDLRKAFEDESSAYLYTRGNNPTLKILRDKMAALDGAEASLILNSGAGAIFCAVLANVQSGDHIISVEKPYTWAQKMFEHILPRFNITTTYVDGKDIVNFENALQQNTKIIYLETPNSWDYQLQDLEAVAKLARSKSILTICDNSYSTSLYQRPIDFGIDLVVQSATKYINGHSDVIAGVLSGRKEMIHKIFMSEYLNLGIGTTPFNAWLMIRGLRTLPVRLERANTSAKKIVDYLKKHPKIETVLYPLDQAFPQYELAKKQMSGAGGLLTFILKANTAEEVEGFCNNLKNILMAVSWGGYESLIIPGIAGIKRENFNPDDPSHRRIRLYVGLEDPNYLIDDLERGFEGMKKKE